MDRSPPIRSKRGHLKVATHPAFRCRRRSSQSSAPKGATPRLLAPFPGSVSCPFGTVSRSPTRAPERRRFQPVQASETFCGSPTPTRKKSCGHPRNLKPCGLLCSPMAKVELDGILGSSAKTVHHSRSRSSHTRRSQSSRLPSHCAPPAQVFLRPVPLGNRLPPPRRPP